MAVLRLLKFIIKHLVLQVVALLGAVGYVLLSNALPDPMARLLAGLVLLALLALLIRRFVAVVRDPVGSVQWPSND